MPVESRSWGELVDTVSYRRARAHEKNQIIHSVIWVKYAAPLKGNFIDEPTGKPGGAPMKSEEELKAEFLAQNKERQEVLDLMEVCPF